MPFYRLKRHVVYDSSRQQTREVWGIDREPTALVTVPAPRDTDTDDPLRKGAAFGGCSCVRLLCKSATDKSYVEWDDLWEWLSYAEINGYELKSGFKNLSPYSVLILQGP